MTFFSKKLKAVSNQAGMTLIEIMIVLAIVGGIMAVLGQNVFKNMFKSQVQQTKIVMGEVTQALQLYYVDCGSYPSSLEGLLENVGNECSSWGPEPYMKKYPQDAWKNDLIYEQSGSSYILKSLGRDRKEGGSGLDADITSDEL
jgi:general secretion pathway protein G